MRALAEQDRLPERIGTVAVDVLEADPMDRVAGVGTLEDWERLVSGLALEAAPLINYKAPDLELDRIYKVNNILCHVGPDAGWKVLGPFLEGTNERLTVAMFDFYASQVLETLTRLGAAGNTSLTLILQTDKAHEPDAVVKLAQVWGDRLEFTPAVVSGPNRLFANSFHTKVAVRDRKALWLSSGNWTPTSQPEIPPGPQPTIYNKGNREWHVVIEDEALAGLFEDFVRWDFRQAAGAGLPEAAPEMPDLLIPETSFFAPEAAVIQPEPFEAKEFARDGSVVSIRPLMTPDNYADRILEVIEGANETLFLQYSYIRPPRDNDKYRKLLDAVGRKMHAGVDVRIIVGSNQNSEDTQKLKALGWDLDSLRIQRSKVHNKGILVDSRVTVVGSHNWSSDGTQYNRDASLIFWSPAITRYFTQVFLPVRLEQSDAACVAAGDYADDRAGIGADTAWNGPHPVACLVWRVKRRSE
jgi:hypothetical protein